MIQPKRDKGFILFIFNCQSLQSSARWYAFIQDSLTAPLPSKTITVTVPDLDNLQIQMNTQRLTETSASGQGQTGVDVDPTSAKEIVRCCMTELRKVDRYRDVLDHWERNYEIGLCWKRYDRIEWLTGMMNRDQYELAGSWSLRNVSSRFSVLTSRHIRSNFAQKHTILHKYVWGSRNTLWNPCLSRDSWFA